jgi:hypothetical protein
LYQTWDEVENKGGAMKNKLGLWGLFRLLVLIGLVLVGCTNHSGEKASPLKGIYVVKDATEEWTGTITQTYTTSAADAELNTLTINLSQIMSRAVGSHNQTVIKQTITFSPSEPKPTEETSQTEGNKRVKYTWRNLKARTPIEVTITTELTVKIAPQSVTDVSWANYKPNDQVKEYLNPSSDIQASDKQITETVDEIINRQNDSLVTRTNKIACWMKKHTKWDNTRSNKDALTVLKDKKGNCQGMANLMAALLRNAGIPTRVVGGWVLGKNYTYTYKKDGQELGYTFNWGNGGSHGWVEVWGGSANGWLPCDPQASIFYVDGAHIKEGEGKNFEEVVYHYTLAPKNGEITLTPSLKPPSEEFEEVKKDAVKVIEMDCDQLSTIETQ